MRFPFRAAMSGAVLTALLVATLAASVSAAGTTRVEQTDGSVQIYQDVTMRLNGPTLWIQSANHKAMLEIKTASCSFDGKIKRCFPSAFSLHRQDGTHPISVAWGTVYINLTNASQQLPLSSKQLPAQSLLVLV
ncbi:MAG: hypothetical protein ACLQPV_08245, partial [Vulcanimicrobiaceae bacterium]